MIKGGLIGGECIGGRVGRIETGHVHQEIAHVDAVFPFILKDPAFAGAPSAAPAVVQIRRLHVNCSQRINIRQAAVVAAEAPQVKIHGDTANARGAHPIHNDIRMVSGAFINAGVGAVGPERALGHVHRDVIIGAVVRVEIEIRRTPSVLIEGVSGAGSIVAGQHNVAVAVIGVHFPSESELAVVVPALRALGFLFGVGQNREEQTGENRNDRDYDQEFNQGKSRKTAERGTFGWDRGCFHKH